MGQFFMIYFLLFLSVPCKGQTDSLMKRNNVIDSIIDKRSLQEKTYKEIMAAPYTQPKKPELFNSGFLDFQNSGQINAAARVFKLYIGEPGKFMLPVSVYSGVSGNNYNTGNTTSTKGSEQMILGIINPMSGVFNISTDYILRIGNKSSLTGFSFVYQLGEKVLTGQQITTYKSFSFFSTYANTGLLFNTGAWERDKEKNMGIFWLLFRGHLMQLGQSFQSLSGYPPDNKVFKGFSIGVGIEINNVLNVKSFYYRYVDAGTPAFDIPIYQITFNYSMRNIQN